MGLFKRVKRAIKGAVRTVAPIATGGLWDPKGKSAAQQAKEEGGDDPGLRATAAKRLAETQKQAGGGQIKYNTEEEV